jgi:hypothetical protein
MAGHKRLRLIDDQRRHKTSWRTFLKAHWESIAAEDFFTTEVWTLGGLLTYYTVFVMDLSTRRAT